MFVMPTDRCNLKCSICWAREVERVSGKGIYDRARELPDARLLSLVDECAAMGVREWNLVGGGEPMVRSDILMAVCERLCSHGLTGAIHTNGTLFRAEHFKHLIAIGWSHIIVSLDGPDRETNDAIRSSGSYERATENIRMLNALRRENGVAYPSVGIQMAITNTNYTKIKDMVALAHDLEVALLGADYLIPAGEECAPFLLTERQRTELPQYLGEAVQVAKKLYVNSNLAALLPQEKQPISSAACAGNEGLFNAACFEPWLSATIRADGRLGPSCVYYSEEADSIKDMSFEAAWTGSYMRHVREEIMNLRLLDYCAQCPSGFRARADEVRHQAHWEAMPPSQRAVYLAKRFMTSLRDAGVQYD